MIYPQKLNSKIGEKIYNILIWCFIVIALLLVLINKLTTPNIHWAGIANCGIIYIWITVIYSIKRNSNIGGHVLLQLIGISAVSLYVDKVTGARGWSIYIAFPIALMVSNTTMLILTIINHKRYIKYAIYQLMIVLISLMPMFLIINGIIEINVLIIIGISISFLNLNISLLLCFTDIKEAIIRKLHM